MLRKSRTCAFMTFTLVALLGSPLLAAGPIGVNVAMPQFVDCVKQAGTFIKDGGSSRPTPPAGRRRTSSWFCSIPA